MMEFLRPIFNEDISMDYNLFVKSGRVFIRDRHWAPDEVLNVMLDKETSNDVFLDWIQERNFDLVSRADDILDKHDQHDRFLRLSESYCRGSVTPFVGAGLSMPSGYPGWTDFLRKQRKQTAVAEATLEGLLAAGDYEGAAQLLANAHIAAFNEEVENAFGCSRELQGPVQYLPYVFDTSVITTNFDDVLKRSYHNATCAFDEECIGTEASELARYLGEGKKLLLKLHGKSTSPKGRILTTDEYKLRYVDDQSVSRAIETLCMRTLLFIGCSLTVDRTLSVMKALTADKGHDHIPRHFAFLAEPATDEERLVRRDQLLECNIYPIWYPQGEHSESIEALLAKLAEGKK